MKFSTYQDHNRHSHETEFFKILPEAFEFPQFPIMYLSSPLATRSFEKRKGKKKSQSRGVTLKNEINRIATNDFFSRTIHTVTISKILRVRR